MSVPVQELIHKWELGAGSRVLKLMVGFVAMVGLAIFYDLAAFRNLSTLEGMDAAQLARNISEGRGYTTEFIRPLSIYLLRRHANQGVPTPSNDSNPTNRVAAVPPQDGFRLDGPHPDLANAPLYPFLLAGVLKAMPFDYPDLSTVKQFSIYGPDLWIAIFNQALFLLAVCMVFRLGRRLFDEPVGWMSAALLLGTDLFWRFSISGLPTMLLVVIILALVEVLARLEPATREGTRSQLWLVMMAAIAGLLTGAAALTRYSFGWLIVPLVLWLASLAGNRRVLLALAAAAVFLVVLAPWVVRNYQLSGAPFGTAGYAHFQNTPVFPGLDLERSLTPDFSQMSTGVYWQKLLSHVREIIQNDFPKFGGSWVSALFLAGLLVPFKNPTLSRLRFFLVSCLVVLTVVQALGRTGLTTESQELNSENLLVVLAPLVFIYGVSLFFVLLEQFTAIAVRYMITGMALVLAAAPLILTFLSPSPSPIAYPPYYPPWIQDKAGYVEEGEWIMTDIPWAVAWYAGRPQSVWLTLKYRDGASAKAPEDFYAIHHLRAIQALYLTSKTLTALDTQSLYAWVRGANEAETWQNFVLGTFLKSEVPTGFPLKRAPEGVFPELFLTDSERIERKSIQSPE